MNNIFTMHGHYHIEACDLQGNILQTWDVDNTLTKINQDVRVGLLLGSYAGNLDDLQIKYFAFGTGTSPTAASDTQLETEIFRKQVTQLTSTGTGVVKSVVSLGALEANTTIREIGVFCGSAASDEPNSGIMLSRAPVNIEKNSNIVLNIIRTDTCQI